MLKRVLLALVCMLIGTGAIAQVGIPESARPGATRPDQVEEPAVAEEPPAQSGPFPIGPVIDRPLEIDSGDRVLVRQFRLLDAVDMPEYDISIAELQEILQGVIDTRPEGFTIGQLEEATEAVTNYYRDRELILAKAVVPVQDVENGVVAIQVMPGLLDRVLVEGNDMYSEKILVEPFRKLIGKPITNANIESALLSLTDYPGLTVYGVFQPGIKVGAADIVLNVQDEKRLDMAYRVDNHGVQETGLHRFRPSIIVNNPTGSADYLQLLLQQAYTPKNNIFYSAIYNRYLGYGINMEVSWDQNKFDVGGELKDSQIKGETINMGGSVSKSWIRGRFLNLSSSLSLTRKESITTTRGNLTNKDRLSVMRIDIDFDQVDARFGGFNYGTISWSHGFNNFMGAMGNAAQAELLRGTGRTPSVEGRGQVFAEGKFDKFELSLNRIQTITPNMRMRLATEYQWTDDLLVPMEQYSIGGPENLRAYPPGQHLIDRALFATVEVIHDMPFITNKLAFGNRTWGELVAISMFYDFARGRLVRPFSSQDEGNDVFMGAGVQATFTLPNTIESRFIAAWEIDIGGGKDQPGQDDPTDPDNGKKPQIWGDLTYRF